MLKSLNIILIVTIIAIMGSCKNSITVDETKSDSDGTAVITFANFEHDFGNIMEGEKVASVFKFRNSGDGDLIIHSATTSCGCTVPRFDNKPIKPGDGGTIEVVFDSSHREGSQTKTITVRSNASVKVVVLRIVAEVITNK